uniref:Uncharacterized protein n=1 Tax=Timema cristinae TaxID=61476 RepID=A0A7R9DKP3_TIMCR|nr:unnamed protein product [Timema cristinae]
MAAVVLEDLYKSYSATPLTDRRANLLMRAVVVTLGILCVSLVFAVERLGSVLQVRIFIVRERTLLLYRSGVRASASSDGQGVDKYSTYLCLSLGTLCEEDWRVGVLEDVHESVWYHQRCVSRGVQRRLVPTLGQLHGKEVEGVQHGKEGEGVFITVRRYRGVFSKGALVGGAAGMVFMSWIVLGTQAVIASGDLSFEAKPVSVEGCSYDFVPPVDKTTGLDNKCYKLESEFPNVVRCCQLGLNVAILVVKNSSSPDDRSHFNLEVLVYTLSVTWVGRIQVFALFRMSYLWYTLVGSLVSMLVALVVSYFTQPNKISSVDRKLLSPVIRRFLPRKTDVLKGVDITSINGCKINMETMVDQVNKRNLEST